MIMITMMMMISIMIITIISKELVRFGSVRF